MGPVAAALAGVGVDSGPAEAAEVVVEVSGDEVAGLELKGGVFDLPEAVDEHAEDVNGDALAHESGGEGEDAPGLAELALDGPGLVDGALLEGAGLAESLAAGGVAVLVEPDVALRAVEEGVVLLVVGTQAPRARSLQHSPRVLPRLLALLPLYELLELLLVSDRPRLLPLKTTVLFDGVEVGEVVEVVYFQVDQCVSYIFADEASDVLVLH